MSAFFYISIGYALGIFIGYTTYEFFTALLILFALTAILYFCRRKQLLSFLNILLLVIFFLTGFVICKHYEDSYDGAYSGFQDKNVIFTGKIVSEPDIREQGVYYIFKPENEKKLIRIFVRDKTPVFNYGDVVEAGFVLKKPNGKRNPGGFDYKKYLKTKKVAATGSVINIRKINFQPKSLLKLWSINIKNKILSIIRKHIPENKSGLIEGMLIGEKENLSEDTVKFFRASGIAHLLTVSGGHAIFFLMPVSFILRKIKFSRKAICVTEIFFAISFCYISGLGVSICRATIMIIIRKLSYILKRDYDSINSLSIAAFLLLIYNPYNLFSTGFQLSFAASLSIISLPKYIDSILKKLPILKILPENIKKAFAMTASAQIGVLPIAAALLKKISLTGFVANLIVIPFISLLYILSFFVIIFNLLSATVLGLISSCCLYMASYIIENLAVIFGNLSISQIVLSLSTINILAYYTLLLLLLSQNALKKMFSSGKLIIKKTIKVIVITILFLMIITPFNSYYSGIEMTFIDVGQGDCALIRMPEKITLLIDTGASSFETENVLRHKNIKDIDILFLTHAHNDHIGGAADLIKNFNIGKIVVPYLYEYEGFDDIFYLSEKKGIQIIKMSSGSEIKFTEDASAYIIGPIYEKTGRYSLNNTSLVLKLQYKKLSILFTGDIEEEAEKDICEKYADSKNLLESLILKVPHHGSSTSLTDEFLKQIKPEVSVVSVGIGNKFGHPSMEVIDKLSKHNKIYRTDMQGAVIINSNGISKVKIKTYL